MRAAQLGSKVAKLSALGQIRTGDLRFRKPTLYPMLSYEGNASVHGRPKIQKNRGVIKPMPRGRASGLHRDPALLLPD